MTNNKKGFTALSPLLFFLAIYLATSIISGDFYSIPISVAFMLSSIYAVGIHSIERGLKKSVNLFSRGASSPNIMLMLWIFILKV